MNGQKRKRKSPRDIEHFEAWCDEHFGEVEDDTAEKAFFRFREEQQGEECDYFY